MFLENAMREVNEQFQNLFEKHTELLTILVISVIVALLVNILASPLQALVERIVLFLHMPKGAVYILLIVILLLCIFSIGILFLRKPITNPVDTFLLVNKDNGIVYPLRPSIEYSMIGTDVLQAYLRDTKPPLSLDEHLIRDLLEVFIVDWLVSTTLFKAEVLSGFSRPKIRYPKFGKYYKTLKTRDILGSFGENRFVKYLEGDHPFTFSSIKLPEKLVIKCRRYKGEMIKLLPNEEPTRVRVASEIQIKGPSLAPLKSFRIVLYFTRITLGEPLLLTLEHGCRSITIGPDKIEYIDRDGKLSSISGEERKKLSSWKEIDFSVVISAEVKPYLFLHPKFREVLDWIKKLHLRATDYFTPKLNIRVRGIK